MNYSPFSFLIEQNSVTLSFMSSPAAITAYANIVGPTGYSVHARHFFSALNQLIPICLVPKFGPLPQQEILLQMIQRMNEINLQGISINLDYPTEMMRFGGKFRIGYTVFETQVLSPAALNQLKQLDAVWVPTHWAKEMLVNQGVNPNQITVIPEGVDCEIYQPYQTGYPEITQLPGTKFLSVGKWENRKGIVELLRAFDQAFSPNDAVWLFLHLPNHVQALKNISIHDEVNRLNLKLKDKIKILGNDFPDELAMAKLYKSCDAYVSAAKAEGWGLPIIEAMACGLPVIALNYSGPTEYLTEQNSFPISVNEFEDVYCPTFFPRPGEAGQWAKVNLEQLIEKLRYVQQNPTESKTKGEFAAQDIKEHWTWTHAAKIAFQGIQKISL